ncbi:MAG TPA: ABC transporter permease, partial [Candidatus Limnocylindrales bacterium]|nr:ABC transporter permease [Candidatus Limnocylindrales bacterium]
NNATHPRVARERDPRSGTFKLLLLVPVLFLALFLVAPIVFMAALSLREDLSGQLLAPFAPTLEHYQQLVDTPSFIRLLLTSAGIAAAVALTTTTLAYPLAYYLRFRAGSRAALLLFLLLLPFWTSYLLRVVAWRVMLGSEGVLNSFLLSTGFVYEPLEGLIYNRGAVIVTLVYVWIPFAAIPILAALQRVKPELHEAAGDLYARPFDQFLRVTLPLSMPGALAAFFMVFIPTVGEYIAPLLVGGTGGTMYGNLIYDFFTRAANWPFGSALSIVMLTATLALTAVAIRVIDVRRFMPR